MDNQIGELKEAWNIWRDCLIGEDQNSIFNQIYLINWNYAIFLIINESRHIKFEKSSDMPPINAPINYFIDRAFLISQSAAIRRVIDTNKSKLTGNKGTYSLNALILDIKNKRDELTRKNYFLLRDLQYDNSDIIKNRKRFFRDQEKKGKGAFFIPKELDSESIEDGHKLFDKLCNKSKYKREPSDIISFNVFDLLINKLCSCESINTYVNKYVAHSATPESRKSENAEELIITIRQIGEAQRDIFSVAEWLASFLFGEGHMALPLENLNLYDYLDIPLISNNDELERIKKTFNEYRRKTEEWTGSIPEISI